MLQRRYKLLVTLSTCLVLMLIANVPLAKGGPVLYQMAITSVPSTYDPAKTNDTSSTLIITQIYDPMFLKDLDGRIIPALVREYEVSADRLRYIFRIREEARFHDGSRVDSDSVLYTIKRKLLIDPGDRRLRVIKGAASFQNGTKGDIEGIKVLSGKTFVIELNQPFPHFIELFTNPSYSIVPKSYDERVKEGVVVGSGPYELVEATDENVVLNRFRRYWHKSIDIDRIVFRVVSSDKMAARLIAKGMLDNTHPFRVDSSSVSDGWHKYSYMHASVRYMGFNKQDASPLRHLNVREAMISVLPMAKYHKRLKRDTNAPISRFIPVGLPGYVAKDWSKPIPHDVAVSVLKKTEWHGKDIVISNYMVDNPELVSVVDDICEVWRSYGVPCVHRKIFLDEFIKMMKEKTLQVFVGKLMPHIPDTYQMLAFFQTDSVLNFTGSDDNIIDELLEKTLQTDDHRKRAFYFEQVNERIHKNRIAVPLKYMGLQEHYIRDPFRMPPVGVTGPFFMRLGGISLNESG